jgi:hypothetical protein
MRENGSACKNLVGRSEKKKQLTRLRSRRNANVVMDLKVVCEVMGLFQDRVQWQFVAKKLMGIQKL